MSDIAVDTSAIVEWMIEGPQAVEVRKVLEGAGSAFATCARASLNFGDCFSYALANARNLPLLYVGDDFSRTDLQRA